MMVLAIGATAIPVLAQTAQSGESDVKMLERARAQRAAGNAVLTALAKPVDSVNFEDSTFEEFIDWLRDQGQINVVPQWRALEQVGIGPDVLLTVRLENTNVREVLDTALTELSTLDAVKFQGVGNTLRISTELDFNRKLHVRVYDVTDLLVSIPDYDAAIQIDLATLAQGQQGGAGSVPQAIRQGQGQGGQGTRFTENQEQAGQATPEMTQLIQVIEDTVEPTTWQTYGGQGVIRSFNKVIVVRNTVDVHEMIAGRFLIE